MAEDRNLIHILKLLDDESPKVRNRVWEKLEANLPAWEIDIRARLADLPQAPRRRLQDLLSGRARRGFRTAWLRWRNLHGDMEKLEAALGGLSWYLAEDRAGRKRVGDGSGPVNNDRRAPSGSDSGLPPRHPSLAPLLDGLARGFRAQTPKPTASALALWLFTEQGFKGADGDYYDPGNSDLVQVIERRQGIPISLACIFMLVGRRLELPIFGCDVPEHFLTRAPEGGRDLVIDCFDGGRVLEADRLAQLELKYAPDFGRLMRTPAEPEAIVARVLRNLINAYHLAGDRQASQFMWSLAEDLRGNREGATAPEGFEPPGLRDADLDGGLDADSGPDGPDGPGEPEP